VEEKMVCKSMKPRHPSHWRAAFGLACLLLLGACASISTTPVATWQSRTLNPNVDIGGDFPPTAPREFRAAWVSTVANIDWPSRKDLNVSQQRAEIIAIVNRAKELNLNALILQVRPSADAIYPSAIEPWSEFLTGEQGRAPSPFYDPLKLWIDEAHERGIELHAWFNPYRARHTAAKSPLARNHIGVTNPAVVKSYGGYLWMDPGEAAAAKQTLDVVLDVVRRYDIDGVHIDDYFYPYPVPVAGSTSTSITTTTPPAEQDFPDDAAWQAFVRSGGKLSRADWRRQSVNALIERMHEGIHREKQWVKFGISPFGLGKPDRRPPGIIGFSQYDKLYADVELWLSKGWLDYLAPQLYWPADQAPQAFGVLLDYWLKENTQSRHVWSGLYTSRIDATPKSWQPQEIVNQIKLVRSRAETAPAVRGQIHFSMVALMQNRKSIGDELKAQLYSAPALIPATPWLENVVPPAPQITLEQRKNVRVKITPGNMNSAAQSATTFAIWAKYGDGKTAEKSAQWQFSVLPAVVKNASIETELLSTTSVGPLSAVVVSAISRAGNESARTIVQPIK
jgi:uncharacterized lipoprotein YddW (UPF0748 family)